MENSLLIVVFGEVFKSRIHALHDPHRFGEMEKRKPQKTSWQHVGLIPEIARVRALEWIGGTGL